MKNTMVVSSDGEKCRELVMAQKSRKSLFCYKGKPFLHHCICFWFMPCWSSGKLPFECQKIAKNLTFKKQLFFQKKSPLVRQVRGECWLLENIHGCNAVNGWRWVFFKFFIINIGRNQIQLKVHRLHLCITIMNFGKYYWKKKRMLYQAKI